MFHQRQSLLLLPFLYGLLFIIAPTFLIDMNYGALTIILFWIPIVIFLPMVARRIKSRRLLVPFLLTMFFFIILTSVVEVIVTHTLQIWTIPESSNDLWGIYFLDLPLEEFVYWYGTALYILTNYLFFVMVLEPQSDAQSNAESIQVGSGTKKTRAWLYIAAPFILYPLLFYDPQRSQYPAWLFIPIPFLIAMAAAFYAGILNRRDLNWRALILCVILFELILFPTEYVAVQKQFWVYNDNRILGLRVLGIPVEEPLIYYSTPNLFVPMMLAWFTKRLGTRRQVDT